MCRKKEKNQFIACSMFFLSYQRHFSQIKPFNFNFSWKIFFRSLFRLSWMFWWKHLLEVDAMWNVHGTKWMRARKIVTLVIRMQKLRLRWLRTAWGVDSRGFMSSVAFAKKAPHSKYSLVLVLASASLLSFSWLPIAAAEYFSSPFPQQTLQI